MRCLAAAAPATTTTTRPPTEQLSPASTDIKARRSDSVEITITLEQVVTLLEVFLLFFFFTPPPHRRPYRLPGWLSLSSRTSPLLFTGWLAHSSLPWLRAHRWIIITTSTAGAPRLHPHHHRLNFPGKSLVVCLFTLLLTFAFFSLSLSLLLCCPGPGPGTPRPFRLLLSAPFHLLLLGIITSPHSFTLFHLSHSLSSGLGHRHHRGSTSSPSPPSTLLFW